MCFDGFILALNATILGQRQIQVKFLFALLSIILKHFANISKRSGGDIWFHLIFHSLEILFKGF